MRKTKKTQILLLVVIFMVVNLCTGCNKTLSESGTEKQEEWPQNVIMYEVNVRQYTKEGTFEAFSEHLPRLKEMGINTLWFMPIHPISKENRSGTLGSYYSVSDYRKVNPEFGTKEEFKALVDRAHDMGFKVVMDWVANHTGWDCEWISKHPEWYTQDGEGNIISPRGMGWPDVADLNYDNTDMRMEMITCMKYWVEEFDIDGFRCDFATGVPVEFWEEARRELETIKPIYMLAEAEPSKTLLNEAFDCCYNWNLYDTLVAVADGEKSAKSIKKYIWQTLPEGSCTLNYLNNHDINSYQSTIKDAFGEDALPTMFALLYTMPGQPLIYTGDEIALDHQIAFMEKDAIDWNSSNVSYHNLLNELGNIRSNNSALYGGSLGGKIQYYETYSDDVLAFSRENDNNMVKCIFNMSKEEQTLNVADILDGDEKVLLHNETEENLIRDYQTEKEIVLEPWGFLIFSK